MYKYRAIYQNKVVEGTVRASTETEAFENLKRQGLIVLSIERIGRKEGKTRVSSSFLESFSKDLIQLLEAGITIDKALLFLSESNKKYKQYLLNVVSEIRQGSSLSDALAKVGIFPQDYIELVRAGEESGNLIESLKLIYNFLHELNSFRRELISSLIYPIFLTITSMLSLIILSSYVIPKFKVLFETTDKNLPFLTKLVFLISDKFNTILIIWLAIIFILLLTIRASTYSMRLKLTLEKILLSIPFLGNHIIVYELIKISNSMYTLLKGGIPLDKALSIVAEVPSLYTLKEIINTAIIRVSEGDSLSNALKAHKLFPELALEILSVGEETGELAGAWYQIYITYSEQFKTTLRRIIVLVEPAVILIMGVLIGLMVFGIILGVYSITGTI